MDQFQYRHHELYAEDVPVHQIVAQFGTPVYIYSRAMLEDHYQSFEQAFSNHPHRLCYAVKANSNIAVLNILSRLGSWFDIVSIGELERVLAAKAPAKHIVFSGVGKLRFEIERALEVGIACFNVESIAELEQLQQIAHAMNKKAPISFRVNPDIDARTHPYIATGLKENKFGIAIDKALEFYQRAKQLPNIEILGVGCHIGSQLTELAPFQMACQRMLELVNLLKKNDITVSHLDLGGGLGVTYTNEAPPSIAEYAKAILDQLRDSKLTLWLEPGRAIAANAGILVARVIHLKPTPHKNFAVIDAAMNDLIRPALYQSIQDIIPVQQNSTAMASLYDVVGPVCETGDFLGKDRLLAINPGELVAIRSAGAYGFTMSSNYNTRPRAAEVMVDKHQVYEIRQRETLASLFEQERCLP